MWCLGLNIQLLGKVRKCSDITTTMSGSELSVLELPVFRPQRNQGMLDEATLWPDPTESEVNSQSQTTRVIYLNLAGFSHLASSSASSQLNLESSY